MPMEACTRLCQPLENLEGNLLSVISKINPSQPHGTGKGPTAISENCQLSNSPIPTQKNVESVDTPFQVLQS